MVLSYNKQNALTDSTTSSALWRTYHNVIDSIVAHVVATNSERVTYLSKTHHQN